MEFKNKYFLLRHGQTIYQKENREINYPKDENFFITLTKEGEEMIKAVAHKLKNTCAEDDQSIDLIISSPFVRTKQTAEIIAGYVDAEIIYDERLVDINMGEFAGKSWAEYSQFFLGKEERFNKRPKDGENWNDILKRSKDFLVDVEKKYQNKNILIISHGDPLWLLAGLLKGFKEEKEFLATRKTENNLYLKVGELIEI